MLKRICIFHIVVFRLWHHHTEAPKFWRNKLPSSQGRRPTSNSTVQISWTVGMYQTVQHTLVFREPEPLTQKQAAQLYLYLLNLVPTPTPPPSILTPPSRTVFVLYRLMDKKCLILSFFSQSLLFHFLPVLSSLLGCLPVPRSITLLWVIP
jgi:hypothetical protein